MKTKTELNEDVEKLLKYLKSELNLTPAEAKIVIRRAYTRALEATPRQKASETPNTSPTQKGG